MRSSLVVIVLLTSTFSSCSVNAFLVPSTTTTITSSSSSLSAASGGAMEEAAAVNTITLEDLDDDIPTYKKKQQPVFSQAIPFLEVSAVLKESDDLAGNFGFDPLGFAQNKESLWAYREAEIKHARLAMLAAVGWPTSELLDRPIAQYYGLSSALDDGDRVPSLLNGGLEKISPVWWGFCLGLTASIDLYGVAKARAAVDGTYTPGDLGFDPLGFYPTDEEGRKEMQLKEIKHGRVAMMAVLGYAVQEYSSKIGVVDETPFFFQPITETAESALQGLVN